MIIDTELANNNMLSVIVKENLKFKRVEYQEKLNKLCLETSEGARIRSKCKWIEQGEKNTSFFHRLEKQRQSNKE